MSEALYSGVKLRIRDIYRASEVSEILLGVDNRVFFLLKTRLFRLEPTFFRYYSIKKVLLETWAPNCEIIPAEHLFFKAQKVTATGYYGTENPLPDVISELRCFMGLL